ncbi:MAG: hypothetical protein AB1345_11380 [Chloroflexota bacterium]
MTLNRVLIPIGLLVLICMLVIGAFAIGVYVGERGWTQGGGQAQADVGPPAQVQQPNIKPVLPPSGAGNQIQDLLPGLPPGRPQVIGRILQISPNVLELATSDGLRLVQLTSDTSYQEADGSSITLQDLKKRDQVAVFGTFVFGDSTQLQADVIVRLRSPENEQLLPP